MTDVTARVETAEWLLTSDTTDPHGTDFGGDIATAFELLAPMQLGWAIEDVLPPVNQPSTASFQIYDSGHHFIIDGKDSFAPISVGDPIGVYVNADGTPLATLQGRVADLQADNHPAGGVVYSVVVIDRLADYASALAPQTLLFAGSPPGYYDQLIAAEGLDLNYLAGSAFSGPWWLMGNDLDLTNTSVLDALSMLVVSDLRGVPLTLPGQAELDPLTLIPRWLALDIDPVTSTPVATPSLKLEEFDTTNDDLTGVLRFVKPAATWLLATADYYGALGSNFGIVLSADQLLSDVGSWRKTRQAAINTVEAQGTFYDTPYTGTPVKTRRKSFSDLTALYGRNSRTVATPIAAKADASYLASALLGRHELVQRGWGLQSFTLLWDQLNARQLDQAWSALLWPQYSGTLGGILGRPVAITDVPDDWRLSDGPVVTGRLLGIDFNVDGESVQLQLTLRGVPPVTQSGGITYTQLAALAGGGPTFANIDPSITFEQLTLAGP